MKYRNNRQSIRVLGQIRLGYALDHEITVIPTRQQ